jgi:hypothetical protein
MPDIHCIDSKKYPCHPDAARTRIRQRLTTQRNSMQYRHIALPVFIFIW